MEVRCAAGDTRETLRVWIGVGTRKRQVWGKWNEW